ncbi:MAG: hypothetical protein KKF89_04400 [Nanoarchaeota archaeon]|nr:hypothetical protein [Nanoarchaeota archaeon]MBU1854936.1 hypothetical protein [Nanoarchaeota archaeon]
MRGKSNIKPLMKKNDSKEDHALLKTDVLEDSKNIVIESKQFQENNPSIWPVESNILIETVSYENDNLHIIFTNLSVEPIKIISTGVKYTSNNTESIDFKETNITIPSGESKISIPCPNGKPFKFVVRTNNGTGAGSSLDNINW